MNIVIQGAQGCGKTTTAEHIAMMYHSERIAWVSDYTQFDGQPLCFDTVKDFITENLRPKDRNESFTRFGRTDKMLVVFDAIPDNVVFNTLLTKMNELKKRFPFVDTIYTTQFKINVS